MNLVAQVAEQTGGFDAEALTAALNKVTGSQGLDRNCVTRTR